MGIYYYNARWYDPALGRFVQADMLVPDPGNSQAFDRYAYVLNNPIKYNDPSGQCTGDPSDPDNPDAACWDLLEETSGYYGVNIINSSLWTLEKLEWLSDMLHGYLVAIGSGAFFILRGLEITIGGDESFYENGRVNIIATQYEVDFRAFAFHELNHALLAKLGRAGQSYLRQFEQQTGWTCSEAMAPCNPYTGPSNYTRNEVPNYHTPDPYDYTIIDSEEDLADSLAIYLEPDTSENIYGLDASRIDFMTFFLTSIQNIPHPKQYLKG